MRQRYKDSRNVRHDTCGTVELSDKPTRAMACGDQLGKGTLGKVEGRFGPQARRGERGRTSMVANKSEAALAQGEIWRGGPEEGYAR